MTEKKLNKLAHRYVRKTTCRFCSLFRVGCFVEDCYDYKKYFKVYYDNLKAGKKFYIK